MSAPRDFTSFLWLLKLGGVLNAVFLAGTFALPEGAADSQVILPARVLFAVNAFRCLFPVRYKGNVVLHDSLLSSVFVTRMLATFAEVAFIYLLSHVIRRLNVDGVGWIDVLSWGMVLQVVISQGCVWGAILGERLALYYYEELGWGLIIAANTLASAWLYWTVELPDAGAHLLELNLLFGAVYLPWQLIHVRALRADASRNDGSAGAMTWGRLAHGLRESIHLRNRRTDSDSWGGAIGLTWMVGYFATLIPLWVHQIVRAFAAF